jgi:hypothetical protein
MKILRIFCRWSTNARPFGIEILVRLGVPDLCTVLEREIWMVANFRSVRLSRRPRVIRVSLSTVDREPDFATSRAEVSTAAEDDPTLRNRRSEIWDGSKHRNSRVKRSPVLRSVSTCLSAKLEPP